MTHSPSSAREDLGYRQRQRTDVGNQRSANTRHSTPSTRHSPRIHPPDPDLGTFDIETSEFARWYAEECKRKGIPNKLKGEK